MFGRRRPRIKRLRKKRDVQRLAAALSYQDLVEDRSGRLYDLGAAIRCEAVVALGEIGGPEAVEALGRGLEDPHPRVRTATVHALQQTGEREAVHVLLSGIVSDQGTAGPYWRERALDILAMLAEGETAARVAEALLSESRNFGPGEARALRTMGSANGHADSGIIAMLVAALEAEERRTQERAEDTLRWMPEGTTEPLIDALGQPRARMPAARLLGKLRESEAVLPLIESAANGDPELRAIIASALGEIKDPRAVEFLLQATTDDDFEVRNAAIAALDSFGSVATSAPWSRAPGSF